MTSRNSTLATSTKPLKRSWLKRNTPLRYRGGSMFKLTADDKAMWKWLGLLTIGQLLPCDGCGRTAYLSRCHLLARGKGGRVIDNIGLLCQHTPTHPGCHLRQEKNTDRYIEQTGVDLYAIAEAHTAQWRKETERGTV